MTTERRTRNRPIMDWSVVSALAESLGAIGVVATLLYLSRQLRENTMSVRRSTTHDALRSVADFNQFVASDPELVDLFWRGGDDPDSLSEAEWHRYVSLASTLIRRFELLYLDHASGALSDDLWEAQVSNIRLWMAKPGAQLWFSKLGHHVHPSFERS